MGIDFTIKCDRCGVADAYGFKSVGQVGDRHIFELQPPVKGHFGSGMPGRWAPFGFDKEWLLCEACGKEFQEQYQREADLERQHRIEPEKQRRWEEWFAKGATREAKLK